MDLAGLDTIILVTSSFHMPRASCCSIGPVSSRPYPTDFRSGGGHGDWMSLVPSAGGLKETSDAVREFIGRVYYRVMFAFEA